MAEMFVTPCYNKASVNMRECVNCPKFEICYKDEINREEQGNGKRDSKGHGNLNSKE